MKYLLIIMLLFIYSNAKDFDFNLKANKIAKNTYFIEGKKEYFSEKNAGDISNSVFITTKDGVIVIDTGSSYLYGKQQQELIKKYTKKHIKYVLNTHHHPDHFLGNFAYKETDILALKYTKDYINKNGDAYITNLINITLDAMKDTEVKAPNIEIKKKYINLGEHKLKVIRLDGHTKEDLVLYDESTGVLFVSDLVFFNRTAATPHANINKWIKALKALKKIPYKVLVPGHGPISTTKEPIKQMISYLKYLDNILKSSAKKGLMVFEILELKTPKEFKHLAMIKDEFERSVINLYPEYENKYLK